MCRRLLYLFSLVVVLSLAGNASADLILHWKFDEGTGAVVHDSSGNGYDGIIEGNAMWVAGKIGGALDFGGGERVVDETAGDYINGLEAITICLWIKSNLVGTDKGFVILEEPTGGDNRNMRYDAASWAWEGGTNLIKIAMDSTGGHQAHEGSDNTQTTDWQHVAMVWSSGNELMLYIDGDLDTPRGTDAGTEGTITGVTKLIIGQGCKDADGGWDGLIDDVQIYNEALPATEIQSVMRGEKYPYAIVFEPTDGAIIKDTWVVLSWSPGDFAVSHDVYLGDNYDNVNEGTGETFQGNQATTIFTVGFPGFPYPEGLVPGLTYYWRIDEVNETEPNSPWKGPVWSFTVPPKTAYTPDPADGAELVETDVELTWTAGFGSKLHTVYFGDNFDDVTNATGGLPQGATTYDPGTLKMAKTYYWRVDEFDVIDTYKGDIWSFTTEGAVGNPNPANGAVDVKRTQIITWSPSIFAASHELYFGTDKDAVKNADTGSPEYKGTGDLGAESYDPGKLELDVTYYWRVDEVNNTNPDSPWPGILWSFTTANYLIVDDFEDYDADENQIWYAWHDGLGYGTPGTEGYYAGNGTGSAVGDENTPSYTEETIVHGGNQSMPVFYDNSVGYSEATLTLTTLRDWTENGMTTLVIWFRGSSTNVAETLYVALNGSAVVNHDNPNAAQTSSWTEWSIPLQAFADQGVNLANVNTIALGLGDKNNPAAGGSGTMYFDDIRLYPPAP